MQSNQAKIEALLFVAGDEGLSLNQLVELTGLLKPALSAQIEKLAANYAANSDCSLQIITTQERFRLATKQEFASLLQAYFEAPNVASLSHAALETLAIIAYKQPVTRVQIEEIRGVRSTGSLQKLLAFELITEGGRLEAPGRPILYQTTENFLNHFGLHSLKDLPALPQPNEEKGGSEQQDLLELFNETLQEDDSKVEEHKDDK
ncbi:SMC-Scp complex subunit ScpB [Liquorilactobacillus satsumensis]|uniref:SMC-Scp complex subunit ScpB n=1 Tax=Liquorilactobacillus satsumensis TaxID=259059 RepID=UPI0039E807C1